MSVAGIVTQAIGVLSPAARYLYEHGVEWKSRYPRCAARFHAKMVVLLAAQRPVFWRLRRAWHRGAHRRWDARASAAGL